MLLSAPTPAPAPGGGAASAREFVLSVSPDPIWSQLADQLEDAGIDFQTSLDAALVSIDGAKSLMLELDVVPLKLNAMSAALHQKALILSGASSIGGANAGGGGAGTLVLTHQRLSCNAFALFR